MTRESVAVCVRVEVEEGNWYIGSGEEGSRSN